MEKELVEFIAKTLVDDPAGVIVNVIEGEKSTILELKVSDGDIGKVIGKSGRTITAIRTLLTSAAAKQGKRAMLEIVEPGGRRGPEEAPPAGESEPPPDATE